MKLVIIMSNSPAVGAFNVNCNTHAYPTKKHHVLNLTDEQIEQINEWMKPLSEGDYHQAIDECWIETGL
jgi:hypothetical protein